MAYELERVKYEFGRISTADALAIRKVMMDGVGAIQKALPQGKKLDKVRDEDLNISAMSDLLADLEPFALKYLCIINPDGSKIERPEVSLLETFFENPFYMMSISAEFFKEIQGFLNRLQSSQNTPKA